MRRGGGRDTPPGWGWGGEKHRPVRAAFRRCRRRPGPEQGVTRNGTEARHTDRHAVPAALWQFLFLGALTGIPCLRVEGAMMAAYHVTGVGWQDGGRFCRGGTNGPPGARDGQSRRTYRTSICTGVRTAARRRGRGLPRGRVRHHLRRDGSGIRVPGNPVLMQPSIAGGGGGGYAGRCDASRRTRGGARGGARGRRCRYGVSAPGPGGGGGGGSPRSGSIHPENHGANAAHRFTFAPTRTRRGIAAAGYRRA